MKTITIKPGHEIRTDDGWIVVNRPHDDAHTAYECTETVQNFPELENGDIDYDHPTETTTETLLSKRDLLKYIFQDVGVHYDAILFEN